MIHRKQAEANTGAAEGARNGSIPTATSRANAKKRKHEQDDEQQPRPPKQSKKPRKKATPKKKKPAAVKSEGAAGEGESGPSEAGVAKINPHRARILVAKQALAAIKEGTSELLQRELLLGTPI